MTLITIFCARCGVTFQRSPWQVNAATRAGHKAYCSVSCIRTRVTKTCEECGAEFTRRASEIANRPSRWCSRICGDIGRKRGVTRDCARCGIAFYAYPSRIDQRYCGPCYHGHVVSETVRATMTGKPKSEETKRKLSENRANRQYGPAHHAWRGGKDPYYGPNWYSQASLARHRDRHTCQDCGLTQKRPKLHVHHLRPRRLFNGDHVAANDLANLVTLCGACHKKREHSLTVEGVV